MHQISKQIKESVNNKLIFFRLIFEKPYTK